MKSSGAGSGTGILERRISGEKVFLDGRKAIMDAEIPERVEGASEKIYKNPAEMLSANSSVLPSLSLIRFCKVKPFIDGVFAALEEKIASTGFRLSRKDFLASLEKEAIGFADDTPHKSSYQYVRALNLLGKPGKKYDKFTDLMIKAICEDDPQLCVPQGFYEWTEELGLAFRQIKACARDFDSDIIAELKDAIKRKPILRDKYNALLEFYSKIANKLEKDENCLFPASVLPDQEFFMKFSQETQSDITGGLGKALVQAIKKGKLNLKPDTDSGLYEYMLWEIVPLVKRDSPEFSKFIPGERYQKSMDDEFISQWAALRHTFVGHYDLSRRLIGASMSHRPPLIITPELEVEPITESYSRMADSLKFLELFFTEKCPEVLEMKRLIPDGRGCRAQKTIGDELSLLTDIVVGLGYLTRDSIHLEYESSSHAVECIGKARKWLKNIKDDLDFDRDVSIYVPIIRTTDGSSQIGYINPGFKLVKLNVEYNKHPLVEFSPGSWDNYKFESATYTLPVLMHREIRTPYKKRINTQSFREMLTEMIPPVFTNEDLDKVVQKLEFN